VSLIPATALAVGFLRDGTGAHTSRTIMLKEFSLLLASCPPIATLHDYRGTVLDDNVLLKRSTSTRAASYRWLRELYTLNREVLIFRVLHELWPSDREAQPLLALQCAAARDSLLRASADYLLPLVPGEVVLSVDLAKAVTDAFPEHYSEGVALRIGRNLASSWQQSGHLQGRGRKLRARTVCHPVNVAYALLLGHLCGVRGDALFETLWARLLDAPRTRLEALAIEASRLGWLEYRSGGGVTEVSFHHLLAAQPTEETA